MEKKQTAVDYVRDEAVKLVVQAMQGILNEDTLENKISQIVTKALQMEKEQIVDAYTECWMNDGGNGFHKVKEAESYYNETYGGTDE